MQNKNDNAVVPTMILAITKVMFYYKIVRNVCQMLSKLGNVCQMFSKLGNVCQMLSKVGNVCQILSKVGNVCQMLSKVGNVCQMLSKVENVAKCLAKWEMFAKCLVKWEMFAKCLAKWEMFFSSVSKTVAFAKHLEKTFAKYLKSPNVWPIFTVNEASLSHNHVLCLFQNYVLRLESSLSRSSYDFINPEIPFIANVSYKHFTFTFEPQVSSICL